jgi:hypothetical protein
LIGYLFEWDKQTHAEAFDRGAVKAAEQAEKMHASKKKAIERRKHEGKSVSIKKKQGNNRQWEMNCKAENQCLRTYSG